MYFLRSAELQDDLAKLILKYSADAEIPGETFTGSDPLEFLIGMEVMEAIQSHVKTLEKCWIYTTRRSDVSWTEIGNVIGCTKQSAQQKFNLPAEDFNGQNVIIRQKANVSNEMSIANAEGSRGNELLSIGHSSLVFGKSDDRWEYRRFCRPPTRPKLGDTPGGWELVCSRFPYHYFKRKVILPIVSLLPKNTDDITDMDIRYEI